MPFDPTGSGMWFTWKVDGDGRRYRDWSRTEAGAVQVAKIPGLCGYGDDDDPPVTGDYIAVELDDETAALFDDDEPGETVQ